MRRLGGASVLALLVALGLLVAGGVALADITVSLYLEVATDQWDAFAPGPTGVAQMDADTMFVVDGDRNNYDEYDDDGINLWEISLTGVVQRTGALSFPEPTGVDYDPGSGTLYVSSDSDAGVYVITAGGDGLFGTGDDGEDFIAIPGGDDVEDPVFDPASGNLFVLNGTSQGRIYRVDLGTETVVGTIPIASHGSDWEGLAITPAGELLAGNNQEQEIHVFDTSGNHLQMIDLGSATGLGGLDRISGLGVLEPGAGGVGYDIWVADRQSTSNSGDPQFNDGRLWRLSTDGTPPPPASTSSSTSSTTSSSTSSTSSTTSTTAAGGTTTTTTVPGTGGTTTTTTPGTPPPPPDPDNPFVDDDGSVFENSIEWLAAEGITSGCNPPVNDRFCPDDLVTRAQMAAFLVRAKGYTAIAADFFVDDEGHILENAINRLATAGVTQGCNPPANDRFCPGGFVTRGQMAAFIVRAFGYSSIAGDFFVDDEGNVFETAINRLATAGVTQGCNPPVNDRYCPDDYVTRGQMAAFLKRALGG